MRVSGYFFVNIFQTQRRVRWKIFILFKNTKKEHAIFLVFIFKSNFVFFCLWLKPLLGLTFNSGYMQAIFANFANFLNITKYIGKCILAKF